MRKLLETANARVQTDRLRVEKHLDQNGYSLCVMALSEALAAYGPPEIVNTDHDSQVTGSDWIDELKEAKVTISIDGKRRWIDNRMVARQDRVRSPVRRTPGSSNYPRRSADNGRAAIAEPTP